MPSTAIEDRCPMPDTDGATAQMMRGARILLESLIREGVDTIFGYPGGAVLHIYDELAKAAPRLRHILARHEQGAVHMAEGYSKASGKVGVVLVTSGPGATNAITGIANAYMDSTPLVVITGQVPSKMIGTDAFQEVDTIGITRPCTKYNYMVRNVSELADLLNAQIVNVSHHLGVLRHAGLVQDVKQGRFVVYSLHPDVFRPGDETHPVDHLDLGCCRLEIPRPKE